MDIIIDTIIKGERRTHLFLKLLTLKYIKYIDVLSRFNNNPCAWYYYPKANLSKSSNLCSLSYNLCWPFTNVLPSGFEYLRFKLRITCIVADYSW